jgi:toxin HigB-1
MIHTPMIKSTKGKMIGRLIAGGSAKGFPPDLIRRTERKIAMIDAATTIEDLRIPPSNHLEMLKGNRKGQYSIRINRQWRICFRMKGEDAFGVEIVDYH